MCSNQASVLKTFLGTGCLCLSGNLVPLLVWKFGFGSVEEFLIYLIGNGALLL